MKTNYQIQYFFNSLLSIPHGNPVVCIDLQKNILIDSVVYYLCGD